MPEGAPVQRVVLSAETRRDVRDLHIWTIKHFGLAAAGRYRILLKQALHDIAENPERAGSQERPELAEGVRTYHISLSRERGKALGGRVKQPRHFIVYRRRGRAVIEILRILHDARDLEHLLRTDVS